MTPAQQRRLKTLQAELRRLSKQLTQTGLIRSGSVVHRFMVCGRPTCRCHADPPQLHGPYWQWSGKVNNKTITRRLSEPQARLYLEWIANRRAVSAILLEMENLSAEAGEILLADVNAA